MCNYHTKFGHKRFSGSEDSRASARLLRLSAHTSGNNKTILVPTFSQPVQSTLLGLLMCPLPLPNKTCYIVMLLPLFKINFGVHHSSLHLAQHGLQNEGHADTPDMSVSMSSSCLCHRKVTQGLLYYFIFCCLIAGGLMVFSVVSRVSSFEEDDLQTIQLVLGEKRMTACFDESH